MFKFNKKSSLEISIQAIVIVVLAMTLLGLGLGFIRGLFSNINKIGDQTFSKIQEQLQNTLTSGNEKLVLSSSKITIERGKSTLLGWGIKNENNYPLAYWAEFSPIRCPSAVSNCNGIKNDLNNKWFTFNYLPTTSITTAPYKVGVADNQVVRVDLNIPQDAQTGLYLFSLKIFDTGTTPPNGEYSSTDLFVTVT